MNKVGPAWNIRTPGAQSLSRRPKPDSIAEFADGEGTLGMKLTDHVQPGLIKMPLAAHDKFAAITELVDLVAAHGDVSNRDLLLKAVLDREAQRSTGIGKGFAIPHAKSDTVPRIVIALGRPAAPLEFAAIDGQPVNLIALLASPIGETSAHIQALARLSRLVTDGATFHKLLDAPDAESLYHVIAESDARFG